MVIKDFGGTNKWTEFKRDLGITSDTDKDFDEYFDEIEKDICRGKNFADYIPEINAKFGLTIPFNFSIVADNVNRFEKNESIWSVLGKAKSKYKVGLLTNMYPGMLDAIKGKSLLPEIEWDIVIDSSVVKAQKPDNEIYEIAQREAGVLVDEILFVENSKRNIDAAISMGWQTFHYESTDPVSSSAALSNLIKEL